MQMHGEIAKIQSRVHVQIEKIANIDNGGSNAITRKYVGDMIVIWFMTSRKSLNS